MPNGLKNTQYGTSEMLNFKQGYMKNSYVLAGKTLHRTGTFGRYVRDMSFYHGNYT
ncbi:unnamed protein product [Dovyalis caffra]|uniref:Uncharacterized protein n=1 Tax=Dovyalis caffra TaxID=77055 RepID=A0AAV1SBL5_9ROSI|nr:unnamed protein product [Dovyalis caffra]